MTASQGRPAMARPRWWAGLLLCLWLPLSLAAEDLRDPRLDTALDLADRGRSAAAMALVGQVLDTAASDRARWFARETLAEIAHIDGRDAAALDLLHEVVSSGEALFGADDPLLIFALRMLAATQGNLGDRAGATRTMLRVLRLAHAAAADDPGATPDLLFAMSDLARQHLDTGDTLAAALQAAEMVYRAQNDDGSERPEAQEGRLLHALALLRMGRPVDAASHALAVWQQGIDPTADAAEISDILDDEFAALAERSQAPETIYERWIAAAKAMQDRRAAAEHAFLEAAEPMMAALDRGDAVAADLAARQALDMAAADDPVVVHSYLALMLATYTAGHVDLAATWAQRLAAIPAPYLAGLVDDPAWLFGEIAARLLSDGRAREAARLAEAAVDLASLRGRPRDVGVQTALALRGAALRDMGRADEAQTVLTRAIELGAAPGPEPARSRATLQALGDLALLHLDRGQDGAAMAVFDRAVAALESGPAGQESAGWLYLLPDFLPLLAAGGQDARARSLAARAVAVAAAEDGGTGPAAIRALDLAARTELALGDPGGAMAKADRALALAEARDDPEPDLVAGLQILAATARFQSGDSAAAAAILAHAAAGQADPGLLVRTAVERANAGDVGAARGLLAMAMSALPPDSPVQPYLAATDGAMLLLDDNADAALDRLRAATGALTQPDRRAEPRARDHLPLHVDTALRLADAASGVQALNYATEAFQVAQRVNDLPAGAALAKSAARLRAGSSATGHLVRDMETAETALGRARETLLLQLSAGGDTTAERIALDRARDDLGRARDALAAVYPDYRAFADPRPLDLVAARRLLRPDEVLVLFATSDMQGIAGAEPSVVMAVTAEGHVWSPLPARAEIAALTAALRCAAALTDRRCGGGPAATRGAFSFSDASEGAEPDHGFDFDAAHRAWATLLAPVQAALAGKSALIVVPDRTLAAMPFHLMLTGPAAPGSSLRAAPWLIRDMSVSVVPSVSSLAAFRGEAGTASAAPDPFLGVGDPLIGSQRNAPLPVDCDRYGEPALLAQALDIARAPDLRAGAADSAANGAVAAMPALPETRCELAATAGFFGPASRLLLQDRATETTLKAMSAAGELERYRVLSFATHGLLAGELGANQAGLVLTPPAQATPQDDGILSLEEIAGLRLDAEFVLLSACNTAAGSRLADDSLSGLASAFFLAGARGLLVSHWPVYSDAAVRLTTGLYAALAADPSTGRAQALRRSMLAVLDDPAATPQMLHPAYWGPFIVAGDGAAR